MGLRQASTEGKTRMADRYPAPKPDVRLSRDDHAWLAKVARREHTSVQSVVDHALWCFRYWHGKGQGVLNEALDMLDRLDEEYQKLTRRQRYFEREYRMQSRRLHDMRREYEKQLWQERRIRRKSEIKLRQERTLRGAYEKRLRGPQSHHEQDAQPYPDAPYGPTVAKLLALAVCTESDGEAETAFEKARALHRLAADSAASTWVQRYADNQLTSLKPGPLPDTLSGQVRRYLPGPANGGEPARATAAIPA